MSSSKPRWGDPIVLIEKNEFDIPEGIPTKQFQAFLDELDNDASDLDTDDLKQGVAILASQIGQLLALNDRKEKDLKAQRQTISELQSRIGLLNAIVSGIEGFVVVNIPLSQSTYTTSGNEIIICNNTVDLLITFNPNPKDQEQIITVRNGTGRVSNTSNKTISGKIIKKILRQFSAPHHIYTVAADAWNVI